MKDYIIKIVQLTRLKNFTGIILVFCPCLFSILTSSILFHEEINFKFIKLILFFFIGSIFSRSAGCIINDIFDQNFDSQVQRTKNRPLAKGTLKNKDAITILVIFSLLSLAILLKLNILAIKIGIFSSLMIALYPLTKRIIHIPQIFLAITFNTGALISYASLANKIDINSIVIYIGCIFWTIGYDTIYSFSDLKDDKKIKINSSALFLEKKNFKLIISLLYLAFFLFMKYIFIKAIYLYLPTDKKIPLILLYLLILSSMFLHIRKELHLLNYNNPQETMKFFKKNTYTGIGISLLLMALKLLQIYCT